MRIISGIYGGRILRSPPDSRTRPTSDRLRETLFNILAPEIDDETRFLDLFAGSGAVGIEALSRGARFVSFVDKSRRACGLIEENLDQLEVPESNTEIFCSPADKFLSRESEKTWDIIFFDPPYAEDYEPILKLIAAKSSNTLGTNGVFLVEHHSKRVIPDAVGEIRRWRILKQGETCLSFFEKN